MPYFIDWHTATHLSDDEQRALKSRIQTGEPDQFGVKDRGLLFDREMDRIYCVLEAPDKAAVKRHHEEVGVMPDAIHEAEAMLRNMETGWGTGAPSEAR